MQEEKNRGSPRVLDSNGGGSIQITELPISELHPFKNHPFRVVDDEAMKDLMKSIRDNGVLSPLVVRPVKEGGYEIISGHRRMRAARLAGIKNVPAIVRNLNDDEAAILMVDSNMQREEILPSEKAYALKMKMDAMKRQIRSKESGTIQYGAGNNSRKTIAEQIGESSSTVQRFIRLTHLIPDLMEMVDEKKVAFSPAVELSYLNPEEQRNFINAYEYTQAAPSLSQAIRLKSMAKAGLCTYEAVCAVLSEDKRPEKEQVTLDKRRIRRYFPADYTSKQIEDEIVKMLSQRQKKKNKQMSR